MGLLRLNWKIILYLWVILYDLHQSMKKRDRESNKGLNIEKTDIAERNLLEFDNILTAWSFL